MMVPQGGQSVYLRAEVPSCSESKLLDGTWLVGTGISGYPLLVPYSICQLKVALVWSSHGGLCTLGCLVFFSMKFPVLWCY
ncbi:hypothetical protein Y032_0019g3879 [Ancylostoma ceylanicum]|uniref:Uncharacterized protein n=1 Tax=Ancylostoma ceylanicum TaxID=53326 RepID=A0A016V2T7_9BILA|nr:hypothetical protein Y032_0019g3879 [Ancylostoma ceylanicum]